MVHYVYYNVKETTKFPGIIFCFDYDKPDGQHSLTTNYLNEITRQISVENAIDKITYLNQKNQWIDWRTNESNGELKTSVFYFHARKCIKIELTVEYRRSQFHLINSRYLLKVFFNQSFPPKNRRQTYLFTENERLFQFSKLSKVAIYNSKHILTHRIDQNKVRLKYRDRFGWIKSPLSFFYGEEDNEDMLRLSYDFRQRFDAFRTLCLPLEADGNDFTIEDELFEQYVEQNRVTATGRRAKSSFKQTFLSTGIQEMTWQNELPKRRPDFEFSLNFLSKHVFFTNEQTWTSLILSLLNVLSLWLDFGILDLQTVIPRIRLLFLPVLVFTKKIEQHFGKNVEDSYEKLFT